jgi:hypothetical protein
MLCLYLSKGGLDSRSVLVMNGVSNLCDGPAEYGAAKRFHTAVQSLRQILFNFRHDRRPVRQESLRDINNEVLTNPGFVQVDGGAGN